MRKIYNFVKNSIIFVYILLIIFVTICLLSYNDYKITVFGNTTLIPIIDENLEPDYTKGDLVIVEKDKLNKVQEGDVVFFYRTFAGEATINYAKITQTERVTDTQYTYTVEGDYRFSSDYFIGGTESAIIIPKVGSVLKVLQSKWGFLFLGVFPSLLAFLYTLYSIIAEVRYNTPEEETEESDKKSKKKNKKAEKQEEIVEAKNDVEEVKVKEVEIEEKVEPKVEEKVEILKEEPKEIVENEEKIETKQDIEKTEENKEEIEKSVKETSVEKNEEVEEKKDLETAQEKTKVKKTELTEEQKKALIEAKLKSMTDEQKKALIEAKLKSMTDEEKRALIEAKKRKLNEQKNK